MDQVNHDGYSRNVAILWPAWMSAPSFHLAFQKEA